MALTEVAAGVWVVLAVVVVLVKAGFFVGVLTGKPQRSCRAIQEAAWFGLPDFSAPTVSWSVVPMFLPVVLVLVAENVGHVRSVAHLAGDDSINRETGRALFADGLATTIAGGFGGSATTTCGENIGVMTATRVISTAAYWVAGVVSILLSMSPKFGAL